MNCLKLNKLAVADFDAYTNIRDGLDSLDVSIQMVLEQPAAAQILNKDEMAMLTNAAERLGRLMESSWPASHAMHNAFPHGDLSPDVNIEIIKNDWVDSRVYPTRHGPGKEKLAKAEAMRAKLRTNNPFINTQELS